MFYKHNQFVDNNAHLLYLSSYHPVDTQRSCQKVHTFSLITAVVNSRTNPQKSCQPSHFLLVSCSIKGKCLPLDLIQNNTYAEECNQMELFLEVRRYPTGISSSDFPLSQIYPTYHLSLKYNHCPIQQVHCILCLQCLINRRLFKNIYRKPSVNYLLKFCRSTTVKQQMFFFVSNRLRPNKNYSEI